MRKPFLLMGFLMGTTFIYAQRLPQQGYINWGRASIEFPDAFANWEKGQPFDNTEDDNFFISRVKPKQHFRNVATQVNQSITEANDKKLIMWVPVNNGSNNALPDGVFDSEVFTMWSYITHFGNWTAPFVRVPGNFTDVAHKNGVGVSVVASIPWGQLPTNWGNALNKLADQGADKMADFLHYYGIDGLGYNSEFNGGYSLVNKLSPYHKALYQKLKVTGKQPLFMCPWYDGTGDDGSIHFDQGLGSHNDGLFGDSSNPGVSLFFNYNWNRASLLSSSVNYARNMGRDPLDLYAGVNMQGGEPRSNSWPLLKDYPISIGLWGAHSQNMFFESRGEKGALPAVQQRTYQRRVESYFTGGSRNPINTPEFSDMMTYTANNEKFFGMSKMMSAKSALSWNLDDEPFITYFNLGNGKFFNWGGERQVDREWYNIGIQDYLPTWRWWFADSFLGRNPENAPAKGLDAEFVWDDAWMGGSLMRVHGTHANEYLHLFKTKFGLKTGDEITVRYKVLNGSANVSLALSAEGNETAVLAEAGLKVVEAGSIQLGEWVEKKFKIQGNLMALNNKTLAMVALHFENANDLDLYLGEFSIVRGTAQKPAMPEITLTKLFSANHQGVDGKVIFNMANDKEVGEPCYNIDVKTSMFKLYAQQEGKEPVLMGATTSWAGMFYAVPLDFTVGTPKVRLGVSALSLDMKSESDIAWGEYQETGEYVINDDIQINKTTIKPGEDFVISYVDPKHEAAKWELLDNTGNVVLTQEGTIECNVPEGLSKVGAYSLRVTGNVADAEGNRTEQIRTFGSYVQITDQSVGALPKILTLTANDKEDDVETEVATPISLKYTGRAANGTGSQGLDLNEQAFGFLASSMNMQPHKSFSISFWVKVNKYNGTTQILNIRDKQEGWPKTDWGWIWNSVKADGTFDNLTFRGTDATSNNELIYKYDNTKVEAGPWNHLTYVFDYNTSGGLKFHLYLNGVKQTVTRWKRATDSSFKTTEPGWEGNVYPMRGANIVAIGGSAAGERGGIDGTVDNFMYWDKALTAEEVKAAMETVTEVPESLHGYWDFENEAHATNGTFLSTGVMNTVPAGLHSYDALAGEGMGAAKWLNSNTFKPGCPFVGGSVYQVVTTPKWTINKGTISNATGSDVEGSANVTFNKPGVYTATLTLENGWGTDSKSINYITVGDATGLESTDLETELAAIPNPFKEEVIVRFAAAGEYKVRIYDLTGVLVAEETENMAQGEFMRIRVNAAPGTYIAQILSGDKLVKAVKLVKE